MWSISSFISSEYGLGNDDDVTIQGILLSTEKNEKKLFNLNKLNKHWIQNLFPRCKAVS